MGAPCGRVVVESGSRVSQWLGRGKGARCLALSIHRLEDSDTIDPSLRREAVAVQESDSTDEVSAEFVVKDAHGNVLGDGDTVTVIKDLKVKGSSSVVKVGTKAKGIRLVDSSDGHNIAPASMASAR